MHEQLAWPALFVLGCYHGLNPGMGWLFAVALGLQERSLRAVVGAIGPIAIGHIVSIALVVALALAASWVFPAHDVRIAAAVLLVVFGIFRLLRARHPRWVGMRVGAAGLMLWAFLMSSAHGAGLMLLPFVMMPSMQPKTGALMVAVHTLGYLLAMLLVAIVVYAKFGLRLLRSAWFNVDLLWAIALILAGVVAFVT
jgi:hypothetical protein